MAGKVMVAMSGGVDSSVAAAVLRETYEVTGAMMRLYDPAQPDGEPSSCCSLEDAEDARQVAHRLGIDFYVFPFGERFRETVVETFCRAYQKGLTPNPCIECNRSVKFDTLLRRAQELGMDYLATGHYVRRRFDETTGRYQLLKGLDPSKDQSYVLYGLTQEQLSRLLFPIGEMTKEQTRALAEQYGFGNAHKPDSQDICFVPDGDYAAFIESYTGERFPEGDFVDEQGRVIGRHKGIIRYTIGQRKGLGVAFGEPMFVLKKDAARNTVTLGKGEALFSKTAFVEQVNWISGEWPEEPVRVTARVRYNQKEQPAVVYLLPGQRAKVEFDSPQRAVTPGQALVCYQGDIVLGGGCIAADQAEESISNRSDVV